MKERGRPVNWVGSVNRVLGQSLNAQQQQARQRGKRNMRGTSFLSSVFHRSSSHDVSDCLSNTRAHTHTRTLDTLLTRQRLSGLVCLVSDSMDWPRGQGSDQYDTANRHTTQQEMQNVKCLKNKWITCSRHFCLWLPKAMYPVLKLCQAVCCSDYRWHTGREELQAFTLA